MMQFLVNVAAIIIGRALSYLLMVALLSTETGLKWYAKFGMKASNKMMAFMEKEEGN